MRKVNQLLQAIDDYITEVKADFAQKCDEDIIYMAVIISLVILLACLLSIPVECKG